MISDWGAVYEQAEGIAAGNDLDMPGPRSTQPILEAVESGRLPVEALDRAVTKILEMLLDMPVMKGRRNTCINREYSRRAAYQGAAEGCVLLKNNGLLPLTDSVNISFIGERSERFLESGGGSAMVYTDQSTGMAAVTRERIGDSHVTIGRIAPESDVVVITVSAWGQEGNDRPQMDIEPEDKELLLETLAKARELRKKVVVVLNISGPVDMTEYIDDADAVLCVFLPGQEGGNVASQILFGDINPSGKLPLTFPRHYRDCPTFGNFPGCAAEVCYGEGILVGYRYYEKKKVKPQFPFGFGLSYSAFSISDLKLTSNRMDMDRDEELQAFVRVKNISRIDGKEVVQLYIRDPKSTLLKPEKELKNFKKVFLKAGEETEIGFTITRHDLESYDPRLQQWVAEAGKYQVLVGNSSDNIVERQEFLAVGVTAYNYNETTMLATLYEDGRAREILESALKKYDMEGDLADCLYYFPHREIGKVLDMLCGNAAGIQEEELKSWKNGIME